MAEGAHTPQEIAEAIRVVLEPWEGVEGPDDQYQPHVLERISAARILARVVLDDGLTTV